MKFSIIIPTYNEQDYIERCLQSIIKQQFQRSEFEIIVSDAQSTDGTVDVARRHADKVVSMPQRGIARGRNAGAREALGEILLFVDADVTLAADFLLHLEKAFTQIRASGRSGVGLVRRLSGGTPSQLHEDVVAVTGKAVPIDGGWFPRFVYRGTYVLVGFFNKVGLPFLPGLCVAYRATAFREAEGFREDFGISEDLDLSRRVSRSGRCLYEKRARAFVSTRRLQHHALSTVLFHIYHDLRYLILGKSARVYPKSEELQKASDLWRMNR